MAEELNLDHFDLGTFVDYVHALKQERDELRTKLPSQGGEAVEVVGWLGGNGIHAERQNATGAPFPLMTVAQHQRILAAATHPADQVADDLTMVKVSRELLQDLRDLAFDQVEHHRAAMGAYKQTRQSAMDSVLAQADALLEVKP